jgi:sortase A
MVMGVGLLAYYGSASASAAWAHDQGLAAFAAARDLRLPTAPQLIAASPTPVAVAESQSVIAQVVADVPITGGTAETPPDLMGAPHAPDRSDWSDKRIAAYDELLRSGALEGVPAAIMRVPSVKLEIPIYEGTEEVNLTRGAGVIEGTAALGSLGNTGLAAHRDGYFRSLKDVALGDLIELEMHDAVHRYRVSEIFVVTPEDIEILDPMAKKVLTLVTCYPFYFIGSAPERYIVRAEAI